MPALISPWLSAVMEGREAPDWQPAELNGGPVPQARIMLSRPNWTVPCKWRLNEVRALRLLSALNALRPTDTIYLYTPTQMQHWASLALGTGNGAQSVFPVPLASVLSETLTVAGAAKVAGTDYEPNGLMNWLKASELFSDAATWIAQGGATVSRTGGQANPPGTRGPANSAWRIQTSGGSWAMKMLQSTGFTAVAGKRGFLRMWIKVTACRKAVTLELCNALGYDGWYTALGYTRTIPADGAWYLVEDRTALVGGALGLAFRAPAAADSLDFVVFHPQYCEESAVHRAPDSTWAYLPTTSNARYQGDTTYGRSYAGFYAASVPTAGQAVVLSGLGRRLMLGALVNGTADYQPLPASRLVEVSATFLCREATP